MANINDNSKITLTVFSVLAGIIFSVGVVYAKVLTAEEDNIKQDQKLEAIYKIQTDIELIKQALKIKGE